MLRLADVVEKMRSTNPSADTDLIKRAYQFASSKHSGQTRRSGEEYILHPLGVADIIAQLKLDSSSVCAALLHDVVEDTDATVSDVDDLFGSDVAFMVDGLTKLSKISFNTAEERQAENIRKMVVAMARDLRVVVVKLADRLHNMRTLEHLRADKQARIARETLDIYAPLADRLGIAWMKVELEDLSFRYLHPEDYKDLAQKIAKSRKEREQYIAKVITILKEMMKEEGLEAAVTGRPKHLHSIWKKMKVQQVDFDDVHDVIAFRLHLEDTAQCYHALGVVHSHFKPLPGRFKDFIALPKPNGYQSLHTTVIGPFKERMEIQIRTHEMHGVAEDGIAAHWKYKAAGQPIRAKDEERFAWLRQIMDWQQDVTDPGEFLAEVKVDLFADEVYVFTPAGDVLSLRRGATPVDFAYSVHTDVGHRTVGAKVNGTIRALDSQLRNGDTVEILTGKKKRPNPDWLSFVATSRARTKIRHHLRSEERKRSRQVGRQLWEQEAKRFGIDVNRAEKKGDLQRVAGTLRFTGPEEMFSVLGYGKIEPRSVIEKMMPAAEFRKKVEEIDGEAGETTGVLRKLVRRVTRTRRTGGIQVDGLDDVLVRFAKCCEPVNGEEIVGYVTRGAGVSVHRADCAQVHEIDPQRRVEVSWEQADRVEPRSVKVRVTSADRPGMLMGMSEAISKCSVNIQEVRARSTEDGHGEAVSDFIVLIRDHDQLSKVIGQLRRVRGVVSVERVSH